jgi:hypothetical protein
MMLKVNWELVAEMALKGAFVRDNAPFSTA